MEQKLVGADRESPAFTSRPLAGVVLAAGESRRMGQPKLLLPWGEGTILSRTLANALAGGIRPLSVVCGAHAARVAEIAGAAGLQCLFNEAYGNGQSTSLIVGLKAAPEGHGLMYILGDQPLVRLESYAALAQAYAKSEALIVAPQVPGGRRGNPVIFAPQLFAEIALLRGDTGARGLIEKYRRQTLLVPLKDKGLRVDIDMPRDYKKYQR